MSARACAAGLLLFACGPGPATGNSAYAGNWPSFVVNGAQNLGGFVIDSSGRFNFSLAGGQVTGAIGGDGSVSGVAEGPSAGICALQGKCTSTQVCSGTAVGDGCPLDDAGRAWATFTLCRGPGC